MRKAVGKSAHKGREQSTKKYAGNPDDSHASRASDERRPARLSFLAKRDAVVAAVKYQVKYSLQDENFDLVALL